MGLKVADRAGEGIGGEEASEAGRVVAGEGVVEAGFGVALVAGEFVAGRASGGLQARHLGGGEHFLAVGSVVLVVAELAGDLAGAVVIFAAAGGDGARGAELIGEIVEQGRVGAGGAGYAGGDAAASEENVFGIILRDASGAVGFREGISGDGAPIKFGEGAVGAVVASTALNFCNTEAVAIINVAIRPAGRSRFDHAAFVVEGVSDAGLAVGGHVAECVVRKAGGGDVIVGIDGEGEGARR